MSLFLRTTALMLLVLSRAPAFAAVPFNSESDVKVGESKNQLSSKLFKHSLSGLYGIQSTNNQPLQPYNDFEILYSKAHQAQRELETLCRSTALLTSTEAHFSGVKSRDRALSKIEHELGGRADRITDLARTTLVANDVPSLVEAYEVLSREASIVKVKNRFKSPAASGYRDLNLLVQLPKTNIIAEVQLHLKAIADVKNGPEHRFYEQIQKFERVAALEKRALHDIEKAQINQFRRQSIELYQNAWQPYITTHIQAA
ncbi:phosphoribosylglycinamide formyltransferase [Vibrio anguillarum]|uniref:phosphoribosylglycinamide formyltransferase n=1 Tax=Vibrio anguillarum TaxID=55601 RepID=UPI00097E3486|nr:phosphoribosylglycinamide formyltransferase [Vibrio anguillarum]MBF4283475.1 phosphoribosylglycinamide formyltransferase [Vibrio anguillarum]MBF4288040.1 phosphoribosylglycinamide formyltransferase [Vibrio anguillarum]MBF4340109.1 phosphoribosylglycinamide formyltransferase [Vibrio anguillarum]MBF4355358.1 phosphoribosylglycinamide formyltransferase [Vibrio anguillarum]MBF4377580.1 phosphoribosylglycinamide formyltransferase [Vibrio anguillarum]